MRFEELNLNSSLQKAITDIGITELTPIQEQAYPAIMSGRDIVGVAQTGTGKTFAYLIPILRNLKFVKDSNPRPRVLIVQPTRELVIQVVDEIEKLCTYTSLRYAGIYGGANINVQKEILIEGVDILVSTPGRLTDMIYNGVLKLNNIQKFVIDEVDEMLSSGFKTQLQDVLDILPEKRQNIMFSATLNRDVDDLIQLNFNNPVRVEVAKHGTPLDKIEQRAYLVPNYNTKVNLLKYLLHDREEMKRVLVFISRKRWADKLFEEISDEFLEEMDVIHSNKTQNYRINSLSNFASGEKRILIATDVVARGIDVEEVSHVISFDLPDYSENYIHRIGRTGRADKNGIAIALVSKGDMDFLDDIEELMDYEIPKLPMPEDVEISTILLESEKEKSNQPTHKVKLVSRKGRGSAFHEKKDKNKKINLGGPSKRNPSKTKPANRGAMKKKFKKRT